MILKPCIITLGLALLLLVPQSDFYANFKTSPRSTKEPKPGHSILPTKAFDHSAWNNLLQKYVDIAGNVDYSGFRSDQNLLSDYINTLSENVPLKASNKSEKLAFYINLYNAATVKLILDNYPLKSIKNIKNPWSKKWIKLGNTQVSLGQIEHKILRKMKEPRIHFAINCASYSCPKLLNRAYEASKIEMQLEQVTKEFINDTTRNRITKNQLELSNIFKWYKKDFTDSGSLLSYIEGYSTAEINPQAKIKYLKYNWSLNESN